MPLLLWRSGPFTSASGLGGVRAREEPKRVCGRNADEGHGRCQSIGDHICQELPGIEAKAEPVVDPGQASVPSWGGSIFLDLLFAGSGPPMAMDDLRWAPWLQTRGTRPQLYLLG